VPKTASIAADPTGPPCQDASQFCADPAKVDLIRQNAKRLYAAFPDAAQELGIQQLLDTPITDAAGVAQWTDSICNASVPLPTPAHTGVLPTGGGVHHYPSPITEIAFFKHVSFQLWVTDAQGNPAAVAPVGPPGSGDGRVHVLYATRVLISPVRSARRRRRASR
jgi:hypothetical protein